MQQENQQFKYENTNIKINFDNFNERHETMSLQFKGALDELAKKTQAQQHWHEQFKMLQIKFDGQNQSLIEIKAQNGILQQQSEFLKDELSELHQKNKVLAHEKWELGQEKAQLFGQLKQLDS